MARGALSLHLAFDADPVPVRDNLRRTLDWLVDAGIGRDGRDLAEIVLAEVLNNVAEHAYDGRGGPVDLRLRRCTGAVVCLVRDHGRPMPGGQAPAGRPPAMGATLDDLPEGGFGWYLIRSLVYDLRYRRLRGCNRLRLALPSDPGPSSDNDAFAGVAVSGQEQMP